MVHTEEHSYHVHPPVNIKHETVAYVRRVVLLDVVVIIITIPTNPTFIPLDLLANLPLEMRAICKTSITATKSWTAE